MTDFAVLLVGAGVPVGAASGIPALSNVSLLYCYNSLIVMDYEGMGSTNSNYNDLCKQPRTQNRHQPCI